MNMPVNASEGAYEGDQLSLAETDPGPGTPYLEDFVLQLDLAVFLLLGVQVNVIQVPGVGWKGKWGGT